MEFAERLAAALEERERRVIDRPDLSQAAVLLPLYRTVVGGGVEKVPSVEGPVAGEETTRGDTARDHGIIFTRRTESVRYHKGQISFPGGVRETGDRDLEQTALRETEEETGIRDAEVRVLGRLDDLVTITQFVVTPVVGMIPHPYTYRIKEEEVEELIEAPLTHFLDQGRPREEILETDGFRRAVYFYDYGRHCVWGATAVMLKNLLEVIECSSL